MQKQLDYRLQNYSKGKYDYLIRIAINIPIYNRNHISYYDIKPLSIKFYDKNTIIILEMHKYQYEQFDVSYLDFIKLAFSNQRFRNLIGRDNIKISTSNRPYILLSLMKMSTPEMTRQQKKKMNPTQLGNQRTMIIHQKGSRMRSNC